MMTTAFCRSSLEEDSLCLLSIDCRPPICDNQRGGRAHQAVVQPKSEQSLFR